MEYQLNESVVIKHVPKSIETYSSNFFSVGDVGRIASNPENNTVKVIMDNGLFLLNLDWIEPYEEPKHGFVRRSLSEKVIESARSLLLRNSENYKEVYGYSELQEALLGYDLGVLNGKHSR